MQRRVFLFGTLRSSEKLSVVLGHNTHKTEPEVLTGHKVVWDANGKFPVLVRADREETEGLVLDLTPEDLARLDWYEGAFGYHRAEVMLTSGPADVYLLEGVEASDAPWSFESWYADAGAMVIEAAREAMRLYPAIPMRDMGARHGMLMGRAASKLRAETTGGLSAVRRGAGRKGVTTHDRTTPHLGFFAVDKMHLTHRRFDGGTETIEREVFLSTDATLVLPYDPKRDEIVLVEQFRAGPFRRGEVQPWSLEPVAGLIDPGETPEACAHREAQEEAGLTFRDLVAVPGGYPSPGATAEYYHLFVGLTDLSGYRPHAGGVPEEGEDILTHVLSLDAALGLLETGEANVLPLAYLLTWTAAHRERLAAM